MPPPTARLLICCPDTPGIIAAVAGFVARHRGNILEADQHTDPQLGQFFMRVEIELGGFDLSPQTFDDAWRPVAKQHAMAWRIHWGDRTKRMAILVSKQDHCLADLLWRCRSGEIPADIAFVAGNHQAARDPVTAAGLPFHHLPITPDNKPQQENRLAHLLDDASVDFVVLARYMQILAPEFVERFPERIINIHHSFLPAFAGPRPYHQAFERGVKIIGATSHYATADLDAGPIIAQATATVGHRDTVEDLVRKGRDLERIVLAYAVRLHVQDKILVSQNKTVVFD
ncbi:MAG: formyltetrahydrofolate deformylase [Phycisphaerae bacterium]